MEICSLIASVGMLLFNDFIYKGDVVYAPQNFT